MATQDALLAAILPRAERLLAERLRECDGVDVEDITERAMAEFRGIAEFSDYAVELRVRIERSLRERVARLKTQA